MVETEGCIVSEDFCKSFEQGAIFVLLFFFPRFQQALGITGLKNVLSRHNASIKSRMLWNWENEILKHTLKIGMSRTCNTMHGGKKNLGFYVPEPWSDYYTRHSGGLRIKTMHSWRVCIDRIHLHLNGKFHLLTTIPMFLRHTESRVFAYGAKEHSTSMLFSRHTEHLFQFVVKSREKFQCLSCVCV